MKFGIFTVLSLSVICLPIACNKSSSELLGWDAVTEYDTWEGLRASIFTPTEFQKEARRRTNLAEIWMTEGVEMVSNCARKERSNMVCFKEAQSKYDQARDALGEFLRYADFEPGFDIDGLTVEQVTEEFDQRFKDKCAGRMSTDEYNVCKEAVRISKFFELAEGFLPDRLIENPYGSYSAAYIAGLNAMREYNTAVAKIRKLYIRLTNSLDKKANIEVVPIPALYADEKVINDRIKKKVSVLSGQISAIKDLLQMSLENAGKDLDLASATAAINKERNEILSRQILANSEDKINDIDRVPFMDSVATLRYTMASHGRRFAFRYENIMTTGEAKTQLKKSSYSIYPGRNKKSQTIELTENILEILIEVEATEYVANGVYCAASSAEIATGFPGNNFKQKVGRHVEMVANSPVRQQGIDSQNLFSTLAIGLGANQTKLATKIESSPISSILSDTNNEVSDTLNSRNEQERLMVKGNHRIRSYFENELSPNKLLDQISMSELTDKQFPFSTEKLLTNPEGYILGSNALKQKRTRDWKGHTRYGGNTVLIGSHEGRSHTDNVQMPKSLSAKYRGGFFHPNAERTDMRLGEVYVELSGCTSLNGEKLETKVAIPVGLSRRIPFHAYGIKSCEAAKIHINDQLDYIDQNYDASINAGCVTDTPLQANVVLLQDPSGAFHDMIALLRSPECALGMRSN